MFQIKGGFKLKNVSKQKSLGGLFYLSCLVYLFIYFKTYNLSTSWIGES